MQAERENKTLLHMRVGGQRERLLQAEVAAQRRERERAEAEVRALREAAMQSALHHRCVPHNTHLAY